MIRRLLLALTMAVLAAALVVPVASAAKPTKTTEPFSGSYLSPAGGFCDFDYLQEYSGTDEVTVFSDGRVQVHEKLSVTHTNLFTGYALTETDQTNLTFYPDGSAKQVAIYWHLRDPNGKIVLVTAGQIRVDADGNVVKITPSFGQGFAADICPALGGNPTP